MKFYKRKTFLSLAGKLLGMLFLCTATCFNALAQNRAAKAIELKQWLFSKTLDGNWNTVSLPHSYNDQDGHSPKYYRGKAYYKKTLSLTNKQLSSPLFLLFEGAAQAATVSINGKQAAAHKGGYTPFVVDLKGLVHEGENTVEVCCDNHEDVTLAPVSSDFNKNGGLHNPAWLLQMNDVYASPTDNGLYRMRVRLPKVTRNEALTNVGTTLVNSTKKNKKIAITLTLTDASGKTVYSTIDSPTLRAGQSLAYNKEFAIAHPHLWNGTADPYLYNLSITITDKKSGQALDKVETKVGYRFFSFDKDRGFFLNGKSYPLRGVAMHQDYDGRASAETNEQMKQDYRTVMELGANVVRLAHYPHRDTAFRLCDSLGLVVQTEIPWVNVCGVNAQQSYFDNLHQQMKEMIANIGNHSCIVFWGMWNEIDDWGNNDKLQGKIDEDRAVKETARLYDYAKSLDSTRFVGLTDCTLLSRKGYNTIKADYISENRYYGWYYGKPNQMKGEIDKVYHMGRRTNLSEYGGGCNPFCHTYDSTAMFANKNQYHYEEYANDIHEKHVAQIMKMPYLGFTTLWIMYDFPVANRREGFMDSADGKTFTESEARKYMNDKGIVTRDRKTKKDAFYLYKAWWNKHEPTVYITSRRRAKPVAGQSIAIKVYSNAQSLTLYQNGNKVQTLNNSGESTGLVWTFKPVKALTATDTFKVVDNRGVEDRW